MADFPYLFNYTQLAAEKRFRKKDGPRVMVCTAAGREGINLQFSRILFNFDLPWNPMDVEQRIGRIHRYGQQYTAQVYNLVLSDTIEGKIFLLLMDKLDEIARTLGKVDENGHVAEDLRGQILGQLNDRLSYDQLYRDALIDPTMKRTRLELEGAMSNANEARKVVFELFQDLDRFSLDEYKPLANIEDSKSRIISFLTAAVRGKKGRIERIDDNKFTLALNKNDAPIICTLDRDLIQEDDGLELIGLDHPIIEKLIETCKDIPVRELGATADMSLGYPAVLTVWLIQSFEKGADASNHVIPISVNAEGKRIPSIEKEYRKCFDAPTGQASFETENRQAFLQDHVEPVLQKELRHRGIASPEKG